MFFYTGAMWWWKQKIHVSWTLALVCVCFVVGVSLAAIIQDVPFLLAALAVIVAVICLVVGRVYVLAPAAAASILVGLGYGGAHIGQRSVYQQLVGREVIVRGKIREDPTKSTSGATSVQIENVVINDAPMPGAVFLSIRSVRDIKRSDEVEGAGMVREGFANFPISMSLPSLQKVIRSPTADTGRRVRDWFAGKVREKIPEPQASLGIGFLTGQKSSLPTELSDALKIAGLTHIVVASGYNLTVLVHLARKLLVRVSKFLAAMSSALMVLSFMAVTGLSPSMSRAGLVSSLSLAAWYYGHTFHPFVLLPLAAAVTVAYQPSYVWGDLGWQLSFAAFAGVMIVSPLLQAYFFGQKEPGVFRQLLGETIAAHVVTIPVIALSFGVISNVALIANLLVVPLVPLAMLLTFICGVGAALSVPCLQIITVPTTWLLSYMVGVAQMVAEIPWAQSELVFPLFVWGIYLVVVVFACFWMWRQTKYSFMGTTKEPGG